MSKEKSYEWVCSKCFKCVGDTKPVRCPSCGFSKFTKLATGGRAKPDIGQVHMKPGPSEAVVPKNLAKAVRNKFGDEVLVRGKSHTFISVISATGKSGLLDMGLAILKEAQSGKA